MGHQSPRGIVLLSLDAVRADHLSFHGYGRNTSPFLDSVAEDNISYRRAYSASSHTREAVPAIITGKDPITFAKAGFKLCTESVATRLQRRGYSTGAFHSNPYLSRAYDFDAGFSEFYDDLYLGRNRLIALAQTALNKFVLKTGDYQARATEINKRSLRWLDSLSDDEPFFLWNHYMDAHGPYNPPSDYSVFAREAVTDRESQQLYRRCVKNPDSITESDRQLLIDLYDGELRYLDARLRDFVSELDRRGLLSESMVIVTSDHGDGFGRHGFYGHPRQLYNELLHVPLIVCEPEGESADVDRPVSTLDIVPTICDRLGLTDHDLPGGSLLPEAGSPDSSEPNPILSSVQGERNESNIRKFAAQTTRWKVVLEREIESTDMIDSYAFDLREDPKELEPLESENDRGQMDLEAFLVRYSKENLAGDGSWQSDDAETTEEMEERLELLGYK